jgi:nitrilase
MSKAAVIQMTTGVDVSENLYTAEGLLDTAAQQGAKLALLPENFNFFGIHDADKLAHAEIDGDGVTQAWLSETARRLKIWIIAGTILLKTDSADGRVANAMLVIDDKGQRVARYDKMHLFDVIVPNKPGEEYRESRFVRPGQRVVCVDTPIGRVGLSVCYDVRFPELYRQLLSQGAEVLVVPAAFTAPTGRAHWEVLLKARAVENLCYLLAAAQSGLHANGRETFGDSLILDPWGQVLVQRSRGVGVVVATIDLKKLKALRTSFPALQNRVLK